MERALSESIPGLAAGVSDSLSDLYGPEANYTSDGTLLGARLPGLPESVVTNPTLDCLDAEPRSSSSQIGPITPSTILTRASIGSQRLKQSLLESGASADPLLLEKERPFDVVLIVGGTSYSVVILKNHMPAEQGEHSIEALGEVGGINIVLATDWGSSWQSLANEPRFLGGELTEKSKEFMQHLNNNIFDLLASRHISPFRVGRILCSVAGPVQDGAFSATNTRVAFQEFRIGEEAKANFVKELDSRAMLSVFDSAELKASRPGRRLVSKISKDLLTVIQIVGVDELATETFNDGSCAWSCETTHQGGSLKDSKYSIAMIIGTGVGGAGGKMVKGLPSLDPRIGEFGHCVLLNQRTGCYEWKDRATLERLGSLTSKGWRDAPRGYIYFEHIAAGPYGAFNFVRKLADSRPDLLSTLSRKSGVPEGDLLNIVQLREEKIGSWAESTSDAVIRPLVGFVKEARMSALSRERIPRQKEAELRDFASTYAEEWFSEIGKGIECIRGRFPKYDIVLVSGISEYFHHGTDFLEKVKASTSPEGAQLLVSKISAREREAVGAVVLHSVNLMRRVAVEQASSPS